MRRNGIKQQLSSASTLEHNSCCPTSQFSRAANDPSIFTRRIVCSSTVFHSWQTLALAASYICIALNTAHLCDIPHMQPGSSVLTFQSDCKYLSLEKCLVCDQSSNIICCKPSQNCLFRNFVQFNQQTKYTCLVL